MEATLATDAWRRLALAALLLLASAACDREGYGIEAALEGVPAIVFARRGPLDTEGGTAAGAGQPVVDAPRYRPGGGLFVLTPPTTAGALRALTAAYDGVDIEGFDLSFDARRVVFSMRHSEDDQFHIWTVGLDGRQLRQRTFGPWNDVMPAYLPGGRVAFATDEPSTPLGTRADEYGRSRGVLQLATSSLADPSDRRLCGDGLGHVADPFALGDGRVGFARWEHRGPVNDVKLFAARPDCTDLVALAGQHGKPANALAQAREVEPGVLVAVATPRRGTFGAGPLVRIDVRPGAPLGEGLLDEQAARFEPWTPGVPLDDGRPASGVGRYAYPTPIPGRPGALLVSWADGDVNERTELTRVAPSFGLYVLDLGTGERSLVIDDPRVREVAAIAAVPRREPPILPLSPRQPAATPAVLSGSTLAATSLDETVLGAGLDGLELAAALGSATRVRVIEGYSAEVGRGAGFGLTRFDGAAIVAEAPVFGDGSWGAVVEPGLPYALQAVDRFGLSIRGTATWVQVAPGETRRCVGCHGSRTAPPPDAPTLAELAGLVDGTGPIRSRLEIPWDGAVENPGGGLPHADLQALFDAKCTECHDGRADELDPTPDPFAGRAYSVPVVGGRVSVPWLRLTDTPLGLGPATASDALPTSYVSLLFPSTVRDPDDVAGTVAPQWIVPGEARRSRLVAKVNVPAEDDPTAWAWPSPPHPEDVGRSLTREERMMLVRSADLGGAYWTRRNVASAERWLSEGR